MHCRASKRNQNHLCALNLNRAHFISLFLCTAYFIDHYNKIPSKNFFSFISRASISNDDVTFLHKIGNHSFYPGIVNRFGNCIAV